MVPCSSYINSLYHPDQRNIDKLSNSKWGVINVEKRPLLCKKTSYELFSSIFKAFLTPSKEQRTPSKYVVEYSTGDLYKVEVLRAGPVRKLFNPNCSLELIVATKCILISIAILPYMFVMMLWRPISVVSDVFKTCIRFPYRVKKIWEDKKDTFAILDVIKCEASFVLRSFSVNIYRFVISFFYTLPFFVSSCYGIFFPLEGMKKISNIEKSLHEGASYKNDLRLDDKTFFEVVKRELFHTCCSDDRKGKVLFLSFCLQKRGNIKDEIEGKKRFTIIKNNA